YIAMRVRYCVTSSRDVTRFCSIAARISAMLASTTVNELCARKTPREKTNRSRFILPIIAQNTRPDSSPGPPPPPTPPAPTSPLTPTSPRSPSTDSTTTLHLPLPLFIHELPPPNPPIQPRSPPSRFTYSSTISHTPQFTPIIHDLPSPEARQ